MDEPRRAALDDIGHNPVLAAVFDLWDKKRAGGFAPHSSEIDMLTLPPFALPYIGIVDVIGNGARFYFRLIGSKIAVLSGVDFTGMHVDAALSGQTLEAVLHQYRMVVSEKRPGYAFVEYRQGTMRSVRNSRLVMPLSSDGIHADRLLLASKADAAWLLQGELLDLERSSDQNTIRSFTLL